MCFCNAAVSSIAWDAFILQPGWAEGVQWSSGGMWCCCAGLCAAGHAVIWAFLARLRSCLAHTQPVSVCTCLQSCIFCFPLAWCGCLQETQSCSSQLLAALGLKSQVLHSCPKTGLAQSYQQFGLITLGVFCSPIPDRAIKTLGGEMEQNSIRWGVELYRLCIQSTGISSWFSWEYCLCFSALHPHRDSQSLENPDWWFYSS